MGLMTDNPREHHEPHPDPEEEPEAHIGDPCEDPWADGDEDEGGE